MGRRALLHSKFSGEAVYGAPFGRSSHTFVLPTTILSARVALSTPASTPSLPLPTKALSYHSFGGWVHVGSERARNDPQSTFTCTGATALSATSDRAVTRIAIIRVELRASKTHVVVRFSSVVR